MHRSVRSGLAVLAIGSVGLLAGACGTSGDQPVATQSTTEITAVSNTAKTSTSVGDTPVTEKIGKGSTVTSEVLDVTTTTAKKGPSTTVEKTGADFAAAAVAAYKAELGDFKGLEMVIHVDNGNSSLQAQDPAKPANVDEYEFSGGEVTGPTPVKLTGDGSLEENLFASTEVAWDQIPSMMDQAKASFPDLEGSKGVTHLIIQKNLPFDSDTVVNVYVDGGPRADGGYVSFKADGTLKKVMGGN